MFYMLGTGPLSDAAQSILSDLKNLQDDSLDSAEEIRNNITAKGILDHKLESPPDS